MTQEEIERLKYLQGLIQEKLVLTIGQQVELNQLRVKLSRTEMERADDPSTPFKDETLSPNLADDKDYKQEQVKRDVQETVKDVKEGVSFFVWLLGIVRSVWR